MQKFLKNCIFFPKSVESLEDLSQQYKVQYAPVVGSSAWVYFKRMANIEQKFNE